MKEHSLVRKIIVFAIFFVALGIIAPMIVFYSMGYRFDKDSNVVVHSGSIVIKVTPTNAKFKLDGKEVDQTSIDLINRSVNINGLAPKEYELEIEALGYLPWKKQVEVHSGVATEFWNVVLIPDAENPQTVMENNFLKYAFSPDKKKIAYFTEKDGNVDFSIRDEAQVNQETDASQDILVYHEALNQRFVPGAGEIKWSPDGQWIIFSLIKDDNEEIFMTYADSNFQDVINIGKAWRETLANQNSQNVSVGGLNKKLPTENKNPIYYAWEKQNDIYFEIDNVLYTQSTSNILDWWKNNQTTEDNKNSNSNYQNLNNNDNRGKDNKPDIVQTGKTVFPEGDAPLKLKEKAFGFTFCGNSLCTINIPERKLEISGQGGNLENSISFPDNYQMTEKYEIFAYSEKLVTILDQNENLFIWDDVQNKKDGKDGMKFIFPGVSGVFFSNDGKKLLFSTNNEAYVYFVRDWDVQPKHVSGDLEVIYRDSEKLNKVQWFFDYQNILVGNKDGIKFIELDSRGGRNTVDFLKNINITDFSYDTNTKTLWFTEKNDNSFNKLGQINFPLTAGILSGIINSSNNQQ